MPQFHIHTSRTMEFSEIEADVDSFVVLFEVITQKTIEN